MTERHRSRRVSHLAWAVLSVCAATAAPRTGFGVEGVAAPLQPAQDARPCSEPEHRQFDFWVGDWEVFDAQGKKAGTNVIQPILDGCALRENWVGVGGMRGTSLNIYDARDARWHQTWVDSRGRLLELSGSLRQGSMVLEGTTPADEPGRVVRHRITWSGLDGGRVRQLWETSRDDGESWSVVFDGTYVPKDSGG